MANITIQDTTTTDFIMYNLTSSNINDVNITDINRTGMNLTTITKVTELPNRLLSVNQMIIDVYSWCMFTVPVLAVFFNGLSIAVFMQRRLSKAAVSLFLIALAVCDTLANSMNFYMGYIRVGWWVMSDLGCQLSIYITGVGRMSAIWIQVFFTAERFISVRYVFKKAELITPRRVKASIALLIVAMLVEQSYILVWQEMAPPYFCINQDLAIREKYLLTLLILNRVINFIIPLILVSIMNTMIVKAVRKSGKVQGKNVSSKENNERRLTVMLVLVSTISFTLLIPETTAKILEALGLHQWTWVATFNMMSDVLSYLSNCCNFFFYVLAGKQFRKDFIDMITCVPFRHKGLARGQSSTYSGSMRNTASSTTKKSVYSVSTVSSGNSVTLSHMTITQ